MNFQIIVMTVAIIILILILTFIGYALNTHRFNVKYPPVTGECPDYWVSKDNECTNPKNLGKCKGSKSFNSKIYMGDGGDCAKSQWATNCDLTWQGITNNLNVCSNVGT